MKKWIFLCFLSSLLFAYDYYGEEEAKNFSASIENISKKEQLSKPSNLKLKVVCPKDFEIKSIAYDYDEEFFKWLPEKVVKEEIVGDQKQMVIKLAFEPKISGSHYLNLPTLHFCLEEDSQKYITLHPPLLECQVIDDIGPSQNEIYPEGLVGFNPKKSIEMDLKNTKNLLENTREDLELAKLKLENKGWKKVFNFLVLFLILGFFCYQIYFHMKKRSKLEDVLAYSRDPREVAKEELLLLKKRNLPQKGLFDDFYVELTQIVRSYIERQYEIKATEQTTQEFLKEVIQKPFFEKTMKVHLEEFLKFADLVKFARLHPEMKECEGAEVAALSFIEASSHSQP